MVRVVRHHLQAGPEDDFEDRLARVAGGEESVDLRLRWPAAAFIHRDGEGPQRFQLRIGDRGAVAQRGDDVGGHLAHLRDRAVRGHAIGAAVQPVVRHQNDLTLGVRQVGFVEDRRQRHVALDQGRRLRHHGEQVRDEVVGVVGALQEAFRSLGRVVDAVGRECGHVVDPFLRMGACLNQSV